MLIDLSGRTALVTGSTQGIGLAIAKGLAESGARVVVNGRGSEKVSAAVATIRAAVPNAHLVEAVADVTTDEGTARLLELVPDLDILISNIGISQAVAPLDITDDQWRNYFDVNVVTGVRLTRAYLPGMMARGWGRLQYIASEAALATPVEMMHYGVSKTALLGVTRGFAKAAAGTGVTVNSVIVGPTRTEGLEGFVRGLITDGRPWDQIQGEFMANYRPDSLIQRVIEPEEIANAVVFYSSDQASASTGGAIRVDGGYTNFLVP